MMASGRSHKRGAGSGGLGSARRRQPPATGALRGAPEWPAVARFRAGHGRGDGAGTGAGAGGSFSRWRGSRP